MQKNKIIKVIFLLGLFKIFTPSAAAYIDPGTGGIIVTSIWTYLSGLLAIIVGFIMAKLIKPIRGLFKKKNRNEKKD